MKYKHGLEQSEVKQLFAWHPLAAGLTALAASPQEQRPHTGQRYIPPWTAMIEGCIKADALPHMGPIVERGSGRLERLLQPGDTRPLLGLRLRPAPKPSSGLREACQRPSR